MQSAEKPSSDMSYEKLKEYTDTHKDDKKSLEKVSEIIVNEKERIPSFTEINEIYNGASSDKRVRTSMGLLKATFDETGVSNSSLGIANKISAEVLDLSKEIKPVGEKKPQVWFKQITQERRHGITKETFSTDEVLVVSRLNNEDDLDNKESSVVIALVKQKDGVPQIGSGNPSLSVVLSESRYQEIINTPEKDLDGAGKLIKNALTGNSTIEQVRESSSKYLHKTLDKYWENWNKSVEGTPEQWTSRIYINERLKRIEGDYTKLLQEVNSRVDVIEAEAKEKQRKRREELKIERAQREEELTNLESDPINRIMLETFTRSRSKMEVLNNEIVLSHLVGQGNAKDLIRRKLAGEIERLKKLGDDERAQKRILYFEGLLFNYEK